MHERTRCAARTASVLAEESCQLLWPIERFIRRINKCQVQLQEGDNNEIHRGSVMNRINTSERLLADIDFDAESTFGQNRPTRTCKATENTNEFILVAISVGCIHGASTETISLCSCCPNFFVCFILQLFAIYSSINSSISPDLQAHWSQQK